MHVGIAIMENISARRSVAVFLQTASAVHYMVTYLIVYHIRVHTVRFPVPAYSFVAAYCFAVP